MMFIYHCFPLIKLYILDTYRIHYICLSCPFVCLNLCRLFTEKVDKMIFIILYSNKILHILLEHKKKYILIGNLKRIKVGRKETQDLNIIIKSNRIINLNLLNIKSKYNSYQYIYVHPS